MKRGLLAVVLVVAGCGGHLATEQLGPKTERVAVTLGPLENADATEQKLAAAALAACPKGYTRSADETVPKDKPVERVWLIRCG